MLCSINTSTISEAGGAALCACACVCVFVCGGEALTLSSFPLSPEVDEGLEEVLVGGWMMLRM